MKKFIICALLISSLVSIPAYAYTTGWNKYGEYNGNTYWYYTESNGHDAKGWQKIDGQWYYFSQEGEGYITSSGWKLINGNWYYFNNNGVMLHDTMVEGYYLNSNGAWTNDIKQVNISASNAEQLVKNYLINNGKYVPGYIKYDNDQGNSYVIHCYDDMGDHVATSGWYYVDKTTSTITSMF